LNIRKHDVYVQVESIRTSLKQSEQTNSQLLKEIQSLAAQVQNISTHQQQMTPILSPTPSSLRLDIDESLEGMQSENRNSKSSLNPKLNGTHNNHSNNSSTYSNYSATSESMTTFITNNNTLVNSHLPDESSSNNNNRNIPVAPSSSFSFVNRYVNHVNQSLVSSTAAANPNTANRYATPPKYFTQLQQSRHSPPPRNRTESLTNGNHNDENNNSPNIVPSSSTFFSLREIWLKVKTNQIFSRQKF
jgi:hypothetical protein